MADDSRPGVDELVDLIGRLEPGVLIAAVGVDPSGRPRLALRSLRPDAGTGVDALVGLHAPPGASAVAVAVVGTSPDHPGELRIDGAVDRAGRSRYRVRDRTGRPLVDSDRASGRLVDALRRVLGPPPTDPGWTPGEHPTNSPVADDPVDHRDRHNR